MVTNTEDIYNDNTGGKEMPSIDDKEENIEEEEIIASEDEGGE